MIRKITGILMSAILILIIIQSCQFGDNKSVRKDVPFNVDSINEELNKIDVSIHTDLKKIKIPSNLTGSIDLSKIIDSIHYVALEKTENSLIGKIDKVIYHDNLLFIVDVLTSKSVFIFTEDGKYVNKISNVGRGPEEYTYPEFVSINDTQKTIEITDHTLHKVFIYDYKGNFKNSIDLGIRFNKYYRLPSGDICIDSYNRLNDQWSQLQNYRLFLTDSLFKPKYLALPYDYSKVMKSAYATANFFSENQGNPLFIEPLNDSIFMYSSKGLQLRYLLNFEDFNTPDDNLNSFQEYYKEYGNNKNYALFLGKLYKVKNTLFINLVHQGKNALVFFNEKHESILYGSLTDMENIKNATYFVPPISTTSDSFISVLQAPDLASLSEAWKNNEDIMKFRNVETIEFVSKINKNDNPVLMFTKLKDKWE